MSSYNTVSLISGPLFSSIHKYTKIQIFLFVIKNAVAIYSVWGLGQFTYKSGDGKIDKLKVHQIFKIFKLQN